MTVDVSAGGFSAESARPLHRGDDVDGFIRVNGSDIAFGGRVVWVKRSDGTAARQTRLGVRFTRVPWDLQKLLEAPATPAGR
jgi:PilZ domain